MENIKGIVFDLDGTLVDTIEDIARAVNTILTLHKRPTHTLDAYKKMVGLGIRALLKAASAGVPFSDEEFESVFQQLMVEYRSKPVIHSKLYPGVLEMLIGLQDQVPLAVLSNKEHGMTLAVVETLMGPVRFSGVYGARPGVPHKPDPAGVKEILSQWGVDASEVAYLGDSNVDMETSHAAGTVACGAAWGFRGREELVQHGAKEVFERVENFLQWVLPRIHKHN